MTSELHERIPFPLYSLAVILVFSAVGFGGQAFVSADHPTATSQVQTQTPNLPALSNEERGDIYMARKSYSDAVDYYYRVLKDPAVPPHKTAVVWNKLGIAYQQLQEFTLASVAYKKSIKQDASFAEPLNNLGTTYYMQDKFKKSTKYYQRAIKLKPQTASFHANLGTAEYRMRKYKDALAEYHSALTLDPDVLTEHGTTGTIVQTRGADPKFFFYIAKSFANVGRPEEAIRYLRRAFEDGFKDDKLLAEDPDFKKLNQNPAYLDLIKNPPVPIRD